MAPDWLQGEAKVTTWLYRVAGNRCIDRMRKHRNRPLPLERVPDPADAARTVDETLQQKAHSVALQTALLALPERQRQAVILRSIEGLTNPEFAEL
jgi:RNA polymerase sigma-70 factor (ECF subfamily)